jgi:hypothetical protein
MFVTCLRLWRARKCNLKLTLFFLYYKFFLHFFVLWSNVCIYICNRSTFYILQGCSGLFTVINSLCMFNVHTDPLELVSAL